MSTARFKAVAFVHADGLDMGIYDFVTRLVYSFSDDAAEMRERAVRWNADAEFRDMHGAGGFIGCTVDDGKMVEL